MESRLAEWRGIEVCEANKVKEPVELRKDHGGGGEIKRNISDATGYTQLQIRDPTGLAEKNYALGDDYGIFSIVLKDPFLEHTVAM